MTNEVARSLHPWRTLGHNPALTEADWQSVYMAQQAFIYQVRRIVALAEARRVNDGNV